MLFVADILPADKKVVLPQELHENLRMAINVPRIAGRQVYRCNV